MFQPLVLRRREPARDNPTMSRYENTEGKHNKFWEISSAGPRLTTHWGRIGTKGQTKTKSFPNAREATYAGLKMIEDKLEGGYHHVRAGQGAAARPVETKAARASAKATARPAKSETRSAATPAQTKKINSMLKAVSAYLKRSKLASSRTIVERDENSRIGDIHVLFMTRKATQKDYDGFLALAKKHGYLAGGAGRTGVEQWFIPHPEMGRAKFRKFKAAEVQEKASALLEELRKTPNSPNAGDGTVYLIIPGLKRIAMRRSWDGERVVRAERVARQWFPGARIEIDYGYMD